MVYRWRGVNVKFENGQKDCALPLLCFAQAIVAGQSRKWVY